MTWGWSHTAEGQANARAQVQAKDREWLTVCWAEIQAQDSLGEFNEALYATALNDAEALPDDVLATAIWDFMEEQATCDNGGFDAWACPFGCHTVPFDPVPQEAHS